MNNAVFGKCLELTNIRLASSWKQASKLINRPSFERAEVFSENFCAIHLKKESTVSCRLTTAIGSDRPVVSRFGRKSANLYCYLYL